ncbi:motility associated factor glycosyltransferase family protein [Desulfitobacterium sp.]|uniref:motility associated factor glycosyltransferase family protein n=1 Tax=Desulfitobacterium sp. TaxID=49981 RepID=UPI002C298A5D|nr:6-hydroxymethylpterin diphosphokinase MptE-like protein [Desulfitobacterium sp.]HVJ50748.1 6-hydroxymethylpterin diphosphokinase MptE-like protein [Desulfitobacterium sp.]
MKDGRVIQILKAQNGQPTLTIDNVLLHSKYDPAREAIALIDHHKTLYQGKDRVVVYGFGLGYHIKELLKRINPDCKLYVFEADLAIFEIAKSLNVVQEMLNDRRVELFVGYSPALLNQFSEQLSGVSNLLLFKPSLKVLPNKFKDFQDAIFDFELGRIGVERWGASLVENDKLNLLLEHKRIEDFLNESNFEAKPIVIASSGPSLDSSIKELKKFRSRFNLFCAGSALRTLMKYQVIPDMICIIDASDLVAKQMIGYENLNVPLCFLNSASHIAVSNYQGPRYIFNNESNQGNLTIETGKSVATALLSIALKGRANPIIFTGQDLAFINNKHHTETFTDIYGESNEVSPDGLIETVLGVNGDQLYSNPSLLSFKRWIERTIEAHPQITFFNSSKGAKIKGTIEKDLHEIFK